MFKVLARNIVANWTGFAVQVAVTFFLTPFVVGTLGDVRYGIWAIVISLTGYYGFLDLGFRSSLTQYLTRYLATKQYKQLNEVASTGFAVTAVAGILVFVASLITAIVAPLIFQIPSTAVAETRWVIFVVGVGAALQFPFFVNAAIFPATQRYDLANAIGIFTRLTLAGGTVLALRWGFGLVGVSVAMLATNLLDYLLKYIISKRLVPELSLSIHLCNKRSFFEFVSFGLWSAVINSGNRIIQFSDTLLIALFLPVAAVAPYSLAAALASYFNHLLKPAAQVFFPVATHLHAVNDLKQSQRLYLNGAKLLFSVAVVGGVVGVAWARPFYELWIDSSVLSPDYPSPASLFSLLALSILCGAGKKIGAQMLHGARRVRPLALLVAGETILNVGVTIALIPSLGLYGVVLGTIIAAFVFQAILNPLVVCRFLNISVFKYVLRVLGPAVALAICMTIACALIEHLLPAANSWTWLVARGILVAPIAGVLVMMIAVTPSQRSVLAGAVATRLARGRALLVLRFR